MEMEKFDVTIKPATLFGEVLVPPSKSISHRAIICASLASGNSMVDNVAISDDIQATIEAMRALGATFEIVSDNEQHMNLLISNEKASLLTSESLETGPIKIECNESGSTARFIIPLFHLVDGEVTFTGKGRLSQRPFTPYYEIFDKQGINYVAEHGGLPLTVKGRLSPSRYEIVGNVSSQFISGLMFVLPFLEGNSEIAVTTPLESKDYIDLTMDCLKAFGVEIMKKDARNYIIKGPQKYSSTNYTVEGDFSQGAFWLVAKSLGQKIEISGLENNSKQADRVILSIIEQFERSEPQNREIDVSQCPDLVPIVSVLGALTPGTTYIINGARVRLKESDRLKAMATELRKIGADIEETSDGLIIQGKSSLRGGVLSSWNDHRIAMALAIASLFCEQDVTIENAQVVNKSYPTFWAVFSKLGGQLDVKYHG